MNDVIRCPDCGHPNPPGSTSCEHCNFPLTAAPAETPSTPAPAPAAPQFPRPVRRPRPRPASNMSTTLWLFFGTAAALVVVFTAVKGFRDTNVQQEIPGSDQNQMQRAEAARAALQQDSTNVDAHIALGDVLYDTGNWTDAIVHYRSAVARDSTRVTAMVDMGVCYFNLGDPETAERLFRLALQREPHQAVALFNLGIVSERGGDYKQAMSYYHRAMQSSSDENLHKAVAEAMERVTKSSGMKAPPLQQGQTQTP